MARADPLQMSFFVDTPLSIPLCNTFSEFMERNPAPTEAISYAYGKAWNILRNRGKDYPVIMASVSGGADSDIMVDMIERIGHPDSVVHYVYFNTGLEYQATFDQLEYLEYRYGIQIERNRAKMPVPAAVKKYGYPFLSKNVSQYIHRLQLNGFGWKDQPFDTLIKKYPNCRSALRWFCDQKAGRRFGIGQNAYLREFLIANPPKHPISDICCKKAKKDTAHGIELAIDPQLSCIGVRKSEGGARSAINSCFKDIPFGCSVFRPIFWLQKPDKIAYERVNSIRHSICYTQWGFKRTGCACCPFGREFEMELDALKMHEPKKYKAVCNVFGPSYEYTRAYRAFVAEQKRKEI